jgi:hypothetical protein
MKIAGAASRAVVMVWIAAGCGGDGRLVGNEVQLSLGSGAALRPAPGACGAGATECTPDNLAGRIYSANVMWGELGPGAQGITVLGANEDVILDPSHGMGGVLEFSLVENTVFAGAHWSPGPGSDARRVPRMEFNYDYLDAALRLEAGGAADGSYVVRTVFVTEATAADVDGTMLRGDKLIRRGDETRFQWCNATACSSDRAEVAVGLIRETKLVEHIHPGDGNPSYIPFSVPLANELRLTGDDLDTAGSVWSAAFDMTAAVRLHAPPETIATPSELLAAFELSYDPDQQHAGEMTRISVRLTYAPGAADASL